MPGGYSGFGGLSNYMQSAAARGAAFSASQSGVGVGDETRLMTRATPLVRGGEICEPLSPAEALRRARELHARARAALPQEARALSREIGTMLEAAEEVRGL